MWCRRSGQTLVIHHMAAHTSQHSSRISLAGAIGVGAAFALLAILEKTHHEAEPMLAGDNARVVKVMLTVLLAAGMTVLSIVCAVHPISKGNLRPLVWLAVVVAAWVAFAVVFDFRGLRK